MAPSWTSLAMSYEMALLANNTDPLNRKPGFAQQQNHEIRRFFSRLLELLGIAMLLPFVPMVLLIVPMNEIRTDLKALFF